MSFKNEYGGKINLLIFLILALLIGFMLISYLFGRFSGWLYAGAFIIIILKFPSDSSASNNWWHNILIVGYLIQILNGDVLQDLITDSNTILYYTIIGSIIVLLIYLKYSASKKTAMGIHNNSVEIDIPEEGFSPRLKNFCRVLKSRLIEIDNENNWSMEYYVPLNAEVEVKNQYGTNVSVVDLLTALQSNNKSRIFLILGEPGSGKSVALRKLCQDLFEEVKKTGKIPIYINLKYWIDSGAFTIDEPPKASDVYNYIINELKKSGDVFCNAFIDKYFYKLVERGRIFFILDSFDEIPVILDSNESSWIIEAISKAIYSFLSDAHGSRGILASRLFKKPSMHFKANVIFEILPFDEEKVKNVIKNCIFYNDGIIKTLFKEKNHLVPAIKNPLCAGLLAFYLDRHNGALPSFESEIYKFYIDTIFENINSKLEKYNLVPKDVIFITCKIAHLIFSNNYYGLEIDISQLENKITNRSVIDVIDILKYTNLGRVGKEGRFSFTHRRLNEYFFVKKLIDNSDSVELESIPNSTKYRDALVLYCEMASSLEAERVATYCWSLIKPITEKAQYEYDSDIYIKALRSMRFMIDAFRSRKECLNSFSKELAEYIYRTTNENNSILNVKLCVEAVGLLPEKEVDRIVECALKIDNNWINETAIKACRIVPNISMGLTMRLINYVESYNPIQFIKKYSELEFSFKLSSAFKPILNYCLLIKIDNYIMIGIIILSTLFFQAESLLAIINITAILLIAILPLERYGLDSILYAISKTRIFIFIFLGTSIYPSEKKMCLLEYLVSKMHLDATINIYLYHISYIVANFIIIYSFVSCFLYRSIFILSVIPKGSRDAFIIEYFRAAKGTIKTIKYFNILKILIRAVLLASLLVILLCAIYYIIDNEKKFGLLLSSFMIMYFLFTNMPKAKEYILIVYDILLIDKYKVNAKLTRTDIYNKLLNIKTNVGRIYYLNMLREKDVNPSGYWPHGYYSSLDAVVITRIAQLDEQWYKLQ